MFFNLVRSNSKKNRKENGLFFVSLIVTIVAFYIILSLGDQDVIIFLKGMESDAVSRLLSLVPVIYMVTLFILFFLVYFAEKYQLSRRNHEFGLYLMMGMRRSKLFMMLVFEEVWSCAISIMIGIPTAVFLSEMISLITAKVIGIGIIGHRFTISAQAVLGTVIGYIIVRAVALLILSRGIIKKELGQLITDMQEEKQRVANKKAAWVQFLLGTAFLAWACWLAISGKSWNSVINMGVTAAIGILGTFLLWRC